MNNPHRESGYEVFVPIWNIHTWCNSLHGSSRQLWQSLKTPCLYEPCRLLSCALKKLLQHQSSLLVIIPFMLIDNFAKNTKPADKLRSKIQRLDDTLFNDVPLNGLHRRCIGDYSGSPRRLLMWHFALCFRPMLFFISPLNYGTSDHVNFSNVIIHFDKR